MSITGRTDDEILSFINVYTAENGYPPALSDLIGHFGIAKSTMHQHLERLEREGLIRRPRGAQRARSRALTITPAGMKYMTSPLEQL